MEFLPDNGHAVSRESGEIMSRRPRRNHTPAFKAKCGACRHQRRSDAGCSLLSSSTFTPIRSHRGRRSLRAGPPMFSVSATERRSRLLT